MFFIMYCVMLLQTKPKRKQQKLMPGQYRQTVNKKSEDSSSDDSEESMDEEGISDVSSEESFEKMDVNGE